MGVNAIYCDGIGFSTFLSMLSKVTFRKSECQTQLFCFLLRLVLFTLS